MSFVRQIKKGRRQYLRAERADRVRRFHQRLKGRVRHTWESTHHIELYQELVDSEQVTFDTPYDDLPERFYWLKDGDWLLDKTDGEPVKIGSSVHPDSVSGSYLFRKRIGNLKPRYYSLARFAWWYHYGWDCGGDQFPDTGGCCLLDPTDPRELTKENLALVIHVRETVKEIEAEQEEQEFQQELEEINKISQRLIRLNHLKTAVRHCAETRYDDPLRECLEANPDIDLHRIMKPDPVNGVIIKRESGKPIFSTHMLLRKHVPLANVMWYLCTGTFAGKLRRRDNNRHNIRLRNIVPDQDDYRKRIGYA